MQILIVVGSWEGPCYYRLILPAIILRERGHIIYATNTIHPDLIASRVAKLYDSTYKLQTQIVPTNMLNYDVIIWQFVWTQETLEILNKIKRVKPSIRHIMDIDDDYFHMNPHNPQYAKQFGKESGRIERLMASLGIVDTLTVTTPILADVYRKHTNRVEVLPNCIDNLLYAKRLYNTGLVCGWYGVSQRYADLWELEGWIPEEMWFLIAGCEWGFAELKHKQKLYIPPFSVLQVPSLLQHMDIGLVPMEDLKFNQSKSPLKGLEYSAAGIPVIASNVGAYQDFIDDGVNGLIVKKPRHWGKYLKELMNDEAMRWYLGNNAKLHAEEMDIRKNIQSWEWVYGLPVTTPVIEFSNQREDSYADPMEILEDSLG